ncbi:hypothetical protein GJ496_000600 [Pomphorhynchus laevis]|nr:hypothetical protein GJ496_000600 [Pomphorhynchus laevis]
MNADERITWDIEKVSRILKNLVNKYNPPAKGSICIKAVIRVGLHLGIKGESSYKPRLVKIILENESQASLFLSIRGFVEPPYRLFPDRSTTERNRLKKLKNNELVYTANNNPREKMLDFRLGPKHHSRWKPVIP